MALTNTDIQKALKINRAVNEYFVRTNLTKVEAKELMPDFIKKGIFNANQQDGLPIRKFLRKLYDEKYLNLIPQAIFEQKDQNKNWFFCKSNK